MILQLRLEAEPTPLDLLVARMQRVLPDPPVFGQVGCSAVTGKKHPIYLATVRWLATMFGPKTRAGAQFLLIETHAGPAWYLNKSTGIPTVGSPLIDLDVLDGHQLFIDHPYRAVFCERGRPHRIVEQLRRSIDAGGFGERGTVEVLEGRFEQTLPPYLDTLRGAHCGVLFADANGSISKALPQLFSEWGVLRNVDVVLWHQARLRRRFAGLKEPGPWAPHLRDYDHRPLKEIVPDFEKQRWLIRRPFDGGFGTRWTMLIGSNWRGLPEWRAGEFYYLDSLTGQAILADCDD